MEREAANDAQDKMIQAENDAAFQGIRMFIGCGKGLLKKDLKNEY